MPCTRSTNTPSTWGCSGTWRNPVITDDKPQRLRCGSGEETLDCGGAPPDSPHFLTAVRHSACWADDLHVLIALRWGGAAIPTSGAGWGWTNQMSARGVRQRGIDGKQTLTLRNDCPMQDPPGRLGSRGGGHDTGQVPTRS